MFYILGISNWTIKPMTDLRTLLAPCPIMSALPSAAIEEAVTIAKVNHYAAQEGIYEQGSTHSALSVVASGSVRISSVNPAGREATLMVLDAGSWFGDNVFSPGMNRVFGATAHEDTTIIELPGAGFRALLSRFPESYPPILDLISRRLWAAFAVIEDDALRGTEARIGRRLIFLAQFKNLSESSTESVSFRLTREQLANMMGMTRQGVHKALKRFEQAGLVRFDYGMITIINLQALKDWIKHLN